MSRAPGKEKIAGCMAWLPQFFDQTCDPARVRTAYRCRAYPDEQQRAVLNRTFGCVRVVWNRTLAARHARWHTERTGTSYAATDRALTVMKKDPGLAFLSDVSSVPLQQALRHQHKAFSAFFARRARYPRFKSRRGRQSAHYTRSAFSLRGGELRLAKTGAMLRFVWSWPEVDVTSLNPAMVIVSREPDGRWYVTFTIEASDPEPLQGTGRAVGIDLGVTDFAVTPIRIRMTATTCTFRPWMDVVAKANRKIAPTAIRKRAVLVDITFRRACGGPGRPRPLGVLTGASSQTAARCGQRHPG